MCQEHRRWDAAYPVELVLQLALRRLGATSYRHSGVFSECAGWVGVESVFDETGKP